MTGVAGSQRVTVTVESVDQAEARAAADLVANELRRDGRAVVRASARDFASGAGVDRPFLTSALLEPFRAGESFPLVGSRPNGDILFDPQWTSAPADAFLVIDLAQATPTQSPSRARVIAT